MATLILLLHNNCMCKQLERSDLNNIPTCFSLQATMSSAPSPRVPPKGEESHSGVFPADSVIVLHPGSRYLRLGRASDPFPVQALHCLARKRRRESQGRHAESFIVKKVVVVVGERRLSRDLH